VPHLRCYLSGHCRSVLRPSQQYPGGSAAAEENNSRKYSDIVSGVDFSPFAIETSKVWGEHALDLVTEIDHQIAAVTHDPKSTVFHRQRLLVAVQRGSAWCVPGTFTNNVLPTYTIMILSISQMNCVSHFVGCERNVLYR